MNTYDKNDTVRIAVAFRNSSEVLTDPTTVRFKYEVPSGSETTLTYLSDAALVRDSAGSYHVDLTLDISGTWVHQFIGTGAVAQVDEDALYVKQSDF